MLFKCFDERLSQIRFFINFFFPKKLKFFFHSLKNIFILYWSIAD